MTQSLVPYSRPYAAPEVQVAIAGAQGVFITVHPENLQMVITTFQSWFVEREDVLFVDCGTTDKTGVGFLIMEWLGFEIDRLFLDILATSDFITDFVAYEREEH